MKLFNNAYVVKSWSAGSEADEQENYVDIEGRAGGLISWLLNLLGISPTASLKIRGDRIIIQQASLEGTFNFVTPMEHICSMFYAFRRPLIEALVLGVIIGLLTFFLLGIPGIVFALLYFFLNKRLVIGFTDLGGLVSEIAFKRSIIEGKNVDETAAAYVCSLVQWLVDTRREKTLNLDRSHFPNPVVEPRPPAPPAKALEPIPAQQRCKNCNQPLEMGAAFCDECGAKAN
jgi:hypothetical protein